MKPSTVIIGIILFAIVTIDYIWLGNRKTKKSNKGFNEICFLAKDRIKLKKYLKQNE